MAAASAYALEPDLVVFQDATAEQHFPPTGDGPIKVWERGTARRLPSSATAPSRLLDAEVVGGQPTALIAVRSGSSPEETYEDLVLVDLLGGGQRTVTHRAAWESSHLAARLRADGDVIGLYSAGVALLLARWSPTSPEPVWSTAVGSDASLDLTMHGEDIELIQVTFDADGGFSPAITVTPVDRRRGGLGVATTEVVRSSDVDAKVSCREWLDPHTLLCGRAAKPPVSIDVDDGSLRPLAGPIGALVTRPRS